MVRRSRKSREEWKIYKNVFDSFTERNLHKLAGQGHFDELEFPIALGKEANVFAARKKTGELIAVKIYRLENCNFNTMYYYINSDPRFQGLENNKRKIIFSWVQREYRNLLIAREKVFVPTPIAFKDNVLLMEFIGNNNDASPKLKDALPESPEEFFNKTISSVKGLIDAGIIHADLSDFNILNHEEEPVFIDLSQGTVLDAYNAKELLERDLKNLLSAFRKSLDIDQEKIMGELLDYYDKALHRQGLKKQRVY